MDISRGIEKLIQSRYLYLSITMFAKIIINLVFVFYVAKTVSVNDFGEFIFSFSISTILTLIFDYGFNLQSLILNDKHKNFYDNISKMISGKLIIIIIILPAIIFLVKFTYFTESTVHLILVLSISSIFNSFGIFFLNLFKVVNKYYVETIGYIVQLSIIILLIAALWYFNKNSARNYAYAILISKIIYFLFSYKVYKSEFSFKYSFSYNGAKKAIFDSFSYAVNIVLGSLIIYIDTFVISIFMDMERIGIYQASIRIVIAAMLFSTIISDAYIPNIARNKHVQNLNKLKLTRLFSIILGIALLGIITLYYYSFTIVNLLYSIEFVEIIQYVEFLMLIVFLRYLNIVPGIILTSYNRQRVRAMAVVISIVVSIFLNLILVPKWGLEGAFISSSVSHCVLVFIYLINANKLIGFFNKNLIFKVLIFVSLSMIIINLLFDKDNFSNLVLSILVNGAFLILFSYSSKLKTYIHEKMSPLQK